MPARKYFIYISKSVKKEIKKIPLPWQFRIMQAITALETDPYYGEKLSGKLAGKRKIRVWPYRIIYKVESRKRIVIILETGHRGSLSVYK